MTRRIWRHGDARRLSWARSVCRSGGAGQLFARAAQRLNLTQTALSHRIRKIEEDLGTRLLVRTSREVSLTMAGQALLPQVRGRLETLAELYGTVRNSGREAMRKVVFASVPTIAGYYLAGLMQTFSEANQGLSVILLDQPAAAVVSTVQRGEAEFGITITAPPPGTSNPNICVPSPMSSWSTASTDWPGASPCGARICSVSRWSASAPSPPTVS